MYISRLNRVLILFVVEVEVVVVVVVVVVERLYIVTGVLVVSGFRKTKLKLLLSFLGDGAQ